jgi:hypothetical protein
MPRKKRPLDRDSGVVRDASLVIIACEDTYSVKQYFARFRTRKVQFIVLPTQDGHSSPRNVMARLDAFKDEVATEDGDLLWVCIDTDHWSQANHIANLSEVLQECRQKRYDVAISNPCFELWLLLHFQEYRQSGAVSCGDIVVELRRAVGGYQKDKCARLAIEPSQVHLAMVRARKMDRNPDEILPSCPTTRIYRLIEILQERDSIQLSY